MEEFMFFLTGGVGLENKVRKKFNQHFSFRQCQQHLSYLSLDYVSLQLENPDPSWLSDKAWDELCRMCDLHGFKDFRFVNLLNYALLDSLFIDFFAC